MEKRSVLFLCTGNSARSQMAEAFLRKYGGEGFEAFSAGFRPREINPYTRRVMEEVGLDLSGHWSKSVMEYMGKRHFSHVITVCDRVEEDCPTTFPDVTARAEWAVEDPAAFAGSDADTLQKFREVRDQIEAHVKALVAAAR